MLIPHDNEVEITTEISLSDLQSDRSTGAWRRHCRVCYGQKAVLFLLLFDHILDTFGHSCDPLTQMPNGTEVSDQIFGCSGCHTH